MNNRQVGVSLIEALVALAVMAFGMLGVVGMQVTLRQNADASKQRSEAVRIAQEAIESWRAYSVLAAETGKVAFADIIDDTAGVAVTGYTTNTSYTLMRTVVDAQESSSTEPARRSLRVDVSWMDRVGDAQGVRLVTQIGGTPPELGAAIGVPGEGSLTRRPRARHATVPSAAVSLDNGTSVFTPPGQVSQTVSWVFNNTTGYITQVCSPACIDVNARLLAGFVRFATMSTQPTAADGELPPSPSLALDVIVDMTEPVSPSHVSCFEDQQADFVSYFCAMPLSETDSPSWSGRSRIDMLNIAPMRSSPGSSLFRICRYTPAEGDTPAGGNADHPLAYTQVKTSLINQNFLVIRAGNNSTTFACPGDDSSTAFSNTNTWLHQPFP